MGYVKYETKGAVAVVTIDREKALNALNAEVLDDLKATFEGIDTETIRCVIVTGAGEKSFVAGADIAAMSGMDAQGGEAFGKKGNDIFRMIETFPLPVIAAVNGFALGGGCELAMSCDFRICAEQAIFGQPEVGLGITPGFGGTQRLARLVGPGMAKQLIYTAKNIKAAEALRIGLVNAVYPAEELMAAGAGCCPRLQEGNQRGTRAAHGRGHRDRGKALRQLLCDRGPEDGHAGLPRKEEGCELPKPLSYL